MAKQQKQKPTIEETAETKVQEAPEVGTVVESEETGDLDLVMPDDESPPVVQMKEEIIPPLVAGWIQVGKYQWEDASQVTGVGVQHNGNGRYKPYLKMPGYAVPLNDGQSSSEQECMMFLQSLMEEINSARLAAK